MPGILNLLKLESESESESETLSVNSETAFQLFKCIPSFYSHLESRLIEYKSDQGKIQEEVIEELLKNNDGKNIEEMVKEKLEEDLKETLNKVDKDPSDASAYFEDDFFLYEKYSKIWNEFRGVGMVLSMLGKFLADGNENVKQRLISTCNFNIATLKQSANDWRSIFSDQNFFMLTIHATREFLKKENNVTEKDINSAIKKFVVILNDACKEEYEKIKVGVNEDNLENQNLNNASIIKKIVEIIYELKNSNKPGCVKSSHEVHEMLLTSQQKQQKQEKQEKQDNQGLKGCFFSCFK